MATYCIDPANGLDIPGRGESWLMPLRTIDGSGLVALQPGDTVKIAKSPDPAPVGVDGIWVNGPVASTKGITSTSATTPINVNCPGHGYQTGDALQITGVSGASQPVGEWIITRVDDDNFTLDGSSSAYAGTGGSARLINAKCVRLASPVTLDVRQCDADEGVWNMGNVNSVSVDTGAYKHGGACIRANNTMYSSGSGIVIYRSTLASDYSAYTHINFWFRVSSNFSAGSFSLRLCSDTNGGTPVDTFTINQPLASGVWHCIQLPRNGGGPLGSNIQSVSLYAHISTQNKGNIYIDNVFASNGFGLASLIGKEDSLGGGGADDEGWYPIQSITGRLVLIDNQTGANGNSGRGYYKATETAPVYHRTCYQTTAAASQTAAVQAVPSSGADGSPIIFSGGWDPATDLQDGMTFFDGGNSSGYGILVSSKDYTAFERLGLFRYYTGLFVTGSTGVSLARMAAGGNGYHGFAYTSSPGGVLSSVCSHNNGAYGIFLTTSGNCLISGLYLGGNSTAGFGTSGLCSGTTLSSVECRNHSMGISIGSPGITIEGLLLAGQQTGLQLASAPGCVIRNFSSVEGASTVLSLSSSNGVRVENMYASGGAYCLSLNTSADFFISGAEFSNYLTAGVFLGGGASIYLKDVRFTSSGAPDVNLGSAHTQACFINPAFSSDSPLVLSNPAHGSIVSVHMPGVPGYKSYYTYQGGLAGMISDHVTDGLSPDWTWSGSGIAAIIRPLQSDPFRPTVAEFAVPVKAAPSRLKMRVRRTTGLYVEEKSTTAPGIINDSGIGSVSWTNPGNAAGSDDQYASAALTGSSTTSNYLWATGFGFTVPPGAKVRGLVLTVEGRGGFGTAFPYGRLVSGGQVVGETRVGAPLGPVDAGLPLGAWNDSWGLALTPEILNDPGFGIAVYLTTSTIETVSIDQIKLLAYYEAADGECNAKITLYDPTGARLLDASPIIPGDEWSEFATEQFTPGADGFARVTVSVLGGATSMAALGIDDITVTPEPRVKTGAMDYWLNGLPAPVMFSGGAGVIRVGMSGGIN